MNAVTATRPASANSAATSPTRRMFSARSAGAKPRSELSPWRRLSPSSTKAECPAPTSAASSAAASVDLPEPESPVNQTTQPRWPSRRSRSPAATAERWRVRLRAQNVTPNRLRSAKAKTIERMKKTVIQAGTPAISRTVQPGSATVAGAKSTATESSAPSAGSGASAG